MSNSYVPVYLTEAQCIAIAQLWDATDAFTETAYEDATVLGSKCPNCTALDLQADGCQVCDGTGIHKPDLIAARDAMLSAFAADHPVYRLTIDMSKPTGKEVTP